MDFSTKYYTVVQIDGDYAHLQLKDSDSTDTILVARALLPEAIREKSVLKYEMLQYELIER